MPLKKLYIYIKWETQVLGIWHESKDGWSELIYCFNKHIIPLDNCLIWFTLYNTRCGWTNSNIKFPLLSISLWLSHCAFLFPVIQKTWKSFSRFLNSIKCKQEIIRHSQTRLLLMEMTRRWKGIRVSGMSRISLSLSVSLSGMSIMKLNYFFVNIICLVHNVQTQWM